MRNTDVLTENQNIRVNDTEGFCSNDAYSDLNFSSLADEFFEQEPTVSKAPAAPSADSLENEERVFFGEFEDAVEIDTDGFVHEANQENMQTTDLTSVSQGEFAADEFNANEEEINSLINDVLHDAELQVDRCGVFRSASSLQSTDATGVSNGSFAGDSFATQDEINMLIGNVNNNEELRLDDEGIVHNENRISGLHGTVLTGVTEGDFASAEFKRIFLKLNKEVM